MPGRNVHLPCLLMLLLAAAVLPAADGQYTIKEGETLFAVARRAQVPVDVLSGYNGISDPARVKAGTVLHVPVVYVAKKGDTLFGIARSFGVPVAKIVDLNKLGQNARLKVGERIFIPQDASPSSVAGLSGPAQSGPAQSGPAQPGPGPSASGTDPAQNPPRIDQVTQTAMAARPGGVVVLPHSGRYERDNNGKMPGLVFFGAPGDVVRAASAGEVKWAATYWTRGKVIIIKSSDGTLYTYGGNAELLVNVGDRVSAGMEIARLGVSPQGGGAKLYFSVSDANGRAVNPEKLFSAKSDS